MLAKIKSIEELRCLSTYLSEDEEFLFFKEGNILKNTCGNEYEIKEFDYNSKKAFKNITNRPWTHESIEKRPSFFRKEWFDIVKSKKIFVEIKRCSQPTYWYKPLVGMNLVFEVKDDSEDNNYRIVNQTAGYYLIKKDCDVVAEEELKS